MLRVTQKEQVLEERSASVCKENEELRASLASLHARLALHDQLNQQHSQQVNTQMYMLNTQVHQERHSFFKANRLWEVLIVAAGSTKLHSAIDVWMKEPQ